jgi:plasmid stabilization system protein ParE
MRVRYTETSAQDLAHSFEYLLARAPSLAAAFADSVDEAVRELLEHPYSAVETEKPGVRQKYIRRFRYRLFYAIDTARDELVICIFDMRHSVGRGRTTRNRDKLTDFRAYRPENCHG